LIGVAETSKLYGHNYISIILDMEDRKVFYVISDDGSNGFQEF
jgi:hypothetical protein